MSAGPGLDKVSILLVDDRPGNLLSLKGVLDRPDYEVVLADSGEQALSLVLRHDFAVILMDVAMPKMDGFEVASILKQRGRFKDIPIIFVTASVQHIEWIFKAYSVGAVDFMQKPLDPHAVRAKVTVFVELFRQKRALQQQAVLLQEAERRERELEVSRLKVESERRYRHLAEAIPHVVWTASPDGAMEYFSERWRAVTGFPMREALGFGWRAAVHPDDGVGVAEAWSRGIESGKPFQLDLRLRLAAGGFGWFACSAVPESEGARLSRWLGTFTDVDSERRAHEESRAAVRLRDEFLSVASHELKTPLSALQLQLQSLERRCFSDGRVGEGEQASKETPRKVGLAVRQAQRLSRLVDSLLDVSRLARGTLELELEEFDLAEAVREVVERMSEDAAKAGCVVEVACTGATFGSWDRLRVEQIVTNLLSNAMRYAAEKPVRIEVAGEGDKVWFSVQDHGMGIRDQDRERIFGRFERAASSRHYGGLGLGLFIVRQIVNAHHGRIEVVSTPEVGSKFIIELPRLQPGRELPSPAAGDPQLAH